MPIWPRSFPPTKRNAKNGVALAPINANGISAKRVLAFSSRKGGLPKANGALAEVEPLATHPDVLALDLNTIEGLRNLVASTLGAVARLPLDIRNAIVIGQLAGTQRTLILLTEFEQRLELVEAGKAWVEETFGSGKNGSV